MSRGLPIPIGQAERPVSFWLGHFFLLGIRYLSTDPSSASSLVNVGNVGKDSSQHVCSSGKSDSLANTF